MIFGVIGVDHRFAADIREKVVFMESEVVSFSANLIELGVSETVILSTCNRSEVYFLDYRDDEEILTRVREAYLRFFDIPQYEDCLFTYSGEEAIGRLFRVAAGLESAIPGEDEILRQVKEAYQFAFRFKNTGKFFNRLFQDVVNCAKEIKSKLKISEIPLSTGYIGLKFLGEQSGGFEGKKLLIVGLGEIGQRFYLNGKDLPLAAIYLCNRTVATAESLVAKYGRGQVVPYEQLDSVLPTVDMVVTAVLSPHVVLKREQLAKREKPLYLLDMAIPRNIDTAVSTLEQCYLYNIDQIKEIAAVNGRQRQTLMARACSIIEERVADYLAWLHDTASDTVIESLNQSLEEILRDHLSYLFNKISFNEKEKKIVSRTVESALKKAVCKPIIVLKTTRDQEKRQQYTDMIGELFQLGE